MLVQLHPGLGSQESRLVIFEDYEHPVSTYPITYEQVNVFSELLTRDAHNPTGLFIFRVDDFAKLIAGNPLLQDVETWLNSQLSR